MEGNGRAQSKGAGGTAEPPHRGSEKLLLSQTGFPLLCLHSP